MLPAVGDDQAVAQEHDAIGDRGGARVVRHDHDRLAEVGRRLAHELEDLGARLGVEVARRLVREDDSGLVDEGACDRDALLLAARELRGLWLLRSASPTLASRRSTQPVLCRAARRA